MSDPLHAEDAIKAVDSIIQQVAELPDRTSPDDWPEAMLVTAGELREIATSALLALLEARDQEKAAGLCQKHGNVVIGIGGCHACAEEAWGWKARAETAEAQLVTQAQENERLLLEIKRCDAAYDERTALLDEWRLMATKAKSRLSSLQAQIREVRDGLKKRAALARAFAACNPQEPKFGLGKVREALIFDDCADRLSLLVEEQIEHKQELGTRMDTTGTGSDSRTAGSSK